MKLSIVIIGDEILLGRVVDTNSGLIARNFSEQGWQIANIRTVADTADAIRQAVEASLAESDLVVTTGGLGPTRDDVTKSVLCAIFGGDMHLDANVLANVEAIFARRGLQMNELTRTQAIVPDSCSVIQNTVGTAPIMCFDRDGRMLVAMPGVPAETRTMLPEVLKVVQHRFGVSPEIARREYTIVGISESALAQRLSAFEDALPSDCHIAYLPSPGRVVLRLECPPSLIDIYDTQLTELAGANMAGRGVMTPAQIALASLKRHSLTIATAESCTGGNIAALLTSIPGASTVMRGGVVAYSNDVKMSILGVKADTLDTAGAVSRETVEQMAVGARQCLGSDYAVATSGIAGPGGGTPDKPVGTVWTAIAGPHGTRSRLLTLMGDRRAIIDRTSATVLIDLVDIINSDHPSRKSIENLFEENKLDQAEEALDNIADNPDNRVWCLYMKGRIAWKKGLKSRAISFYAEAAGLDPTSEASTALEQARTVMDFYNKDLYNP